MIKYGMEISKKKEVEHNGTKQEDNDRWEQILHQDLKLQGSKTQAK